VAGCGLVHTDAEAREAWTVVDARSADVDLTLAVLTSEGCQPVAARLDDGVSAESGLA
jgi:hypothetical protein